MEVVWRHFPLHPGVPEEGMLLREMFRGRGFDLDAAHARLATLMKAEGLPFVANERTWNTRRAQELSAWADSTGRPSLHDALFRMGFVDGKNLSDREALADAAVSAGIDRAEALDAMAQREGKAVVDRDWADARAMGITGVPTFVVGRNGVVGAQPYAVLESLVLRAGATRR